MKRYAAFCRHVLTESMAHVLPRSQAVGGCAEALRMQVVGPHETARTGELLGGPRAAARLLSLHGWDVVYLPVGQLPAGLSHRQQLTRMADLLRKHSVPTRRRAARQ